MNPCYNPILNKWFFGKDHTGLSTTFLEGYDDPTYHTFKVEFGDWGAATAGNKSIIELGTTTFKAQYADYDLLPYGLLNCPLANDGANSYEWQNGASLDYTIFNNTQSYSAFTFLRSRNEDVRASYLYHFVNGLMDILREYPYIFLKISGLESLLKFDPNTGVRLKDAKITLECIEGLDLKIKTLLEFYKMAAWDSVYQRYILPENMREFKMVIYIFERRTFQNSKWGVDDINYDVPIKAFECCPCEIDLSNTIWESNYDATGENSTAASTKIVINVKNVKEFYKNGLLNTNLQHTYHENSKVNGLSEQIAPILVYDLIDHIDKYKFVYTKKGRQGSINSGSCSLNGVRALFMSKEIFQSTEEFSTTIQNYPTWDSITVNGSSENTQVVSLNELRYRRGETDTLKPKNALLGGKLNNVTYHNSTSVALESILNYLDMKSNNYVVPTQAQTYKPSTAALDYTDPIPASYMANSLYYRPNLIESVLGRWLDSIFGIDSTYNYFNSYLDFLFEPRQVFDQNMIYMLDKERQKELFLSQELENPRLYDKQQMNELEEERKKPELDEPLLENPREQVEQLFVKPEKYRKLPDQEFENLEKERKLPDSQFNELDKERKKAKLEFNELDKERKLPDQDFSELSDAREIKDLQFSEIDNAREHTILEYGKVDKARDHVEQQYNELDNARLKPNQQFNNIEKERSKPNLQFSYLDDIRKVPESIDQLIQKIRNIPGLENIELDDIRNLPESDLLSLAEQTTRLLPEYSANKLELIDTISSAVDLVKLEFIDINIKESEREKELIQDLKNYTKLVNLREISDNEDIKKKQEIFLLAADYANNSEDYKKLYADKVIKLKELLKETTLEAVRTLPEVGMFTISKDEKTNKKKEQVLLSVNDIRQIASNVKLIGMKDATIRLMSMQTLIKLNDEFNKQQINTAGMIGLTENVERTISQNLISTKEQSEKAAKKRNKRLGKTNIDDTTKGTKGRKKKKQEIVY